MVKKKFVKKALKRVGALALSAAFMVSSLAGCGSSSDSDSSTSSSDDPITITVFSQRANYSGEQIGWSAKVLKDKFNVVLNIVPNGDGVFDTRMESGDLGDIVIFGSEPDYITAMNAGLLFDWEEDDTLADCGSYIQENMYYNLERNRDIAESETGEAKIYGLGYECATSSEDVQFSLYTWDIRWDLYKELGYPEINDLDDFVEVMKQMKEICPTDEAGKPTYAVSMWPDWDGNMVMYVKATATAYYGYDEFQLGLYNPVDGHFYGALGNPNDESEESPYLEMLKFYNTLYQNDLVDPDSMTATYDTAVTTKTKNGGTFFSIFNYAGYLAYNTEAHISENKMMRSLKPAEASPIAYGLSVLGGNNYWAIGSKSEYPDLCMEIINYLCTPEGCMTYLYGPKGVMWDYDDEGYTYFTELGKKCSNDNTTVLEGDEAGDYAGLGTFHDGELQINCTTWTADADNPDSNGETYNSEHWLSEQGDALCDIDQDWRDYTGCTSVDEYLASGKYTVSPASAYTSTTQSDELKTTWSQVTKCIVEGSWNAIYAESDEEFDQIVADMIEQAYSYGYEECWQYSNDEAALRKAAEDAVSSQDTTSED